MLSKPLSAEQVAVLGERLDRIDNDLKNCDLTHDQNQIAVLRAIAEEILVVLHSHYELTRELQARLSDPS